MKKKLAIIGASYFQNPLILKAKEMGLETHVFAWQCGDVGEETADFFYPISITEKEEIAKQCKSIGIDGIASIASDLANITVAYVAEKLGLVANSVECVFKSTNKHAMRDAFSAGGDFSSRSYLVGIDSDYAKLRLTYPIIVKPVDRSGSRGITKLDEPEGLEDAVKTAIAESFSDKAVVEEFVDGDEFSVEGISWRGEHQILAITKKFTTGAPHFIETGHVQPSGLSEDQEARIVSVVSHALQTLGVTNGASHSEVKVDKNGQVSIIEIGSRMGGDCIGSHLVGLSTGYDFVGNVIRIALGKEPEAFVDGGRGAAAIRFIFGDEDLRILGLLEQTESLVERFVASDKGEITDSSSRHGYYVFSGDGVLSLQPYLPSDS